MALSVQKNLSLTFVLFSNTSSPTSSEENKGTGIYIVYDLSMFLPMSVNSGKRMEIVSVGVRLSCHLILNISFIEGE